MTRPKITQCTPLDMRFVEEFIKCGNMTEAASRAYKDKSRKYCNFRGTQLMKEERIKNALVNRRAVMEANANLGAQRIQKIIEEGKDKVALDASIFSIEQIDGKATQVIEQKSTGITLNIDLTGALALGGGDGNKEQTN